MIVNCYNDKHSCTLFVLVLLWFCLFIHSNYFKRFSCYHLYGEIKLCKIDGDDDEEQSLSGISSVLLAIFLSSTFTLVVATAAGLGLYCCWIRMKKNAKSKLSIVACYLKFWCAVQLLLHVLHFRFFVVSRVHFHLVDSNSVSWVDDCMEDKQEDKVRNDLCCIVCNHSITGAITVHSVVAPPGELRVNAGVVWLAGNTVWSTPERIRGEVLTTMRYTNRRLPYLTLSITKGTLCYTVL